MSESISQQRLDELWDFDDPALSERRFRAAVGELVPSTTAAAELTTQLARAIGLQGRFDEADALLESIIDPEGVVAARVLLERGRLRNSAGRPAEAIPLFESALPIAAAEGQDFVGLDAAHMLAIADSARAAHWTDRALETVEETDDARTKRWGVSLHNNLGWNLFDSGDLTGALAEFELAADAARDVGTPAQQRQAQDAIDETVKALGR